MGHRNMRYTGPIIDMEVDQQDRGLFHPEPCVFYGSMPNFPQPNVQPLLPLPGNSTNFDIHHLPEHGGAASYGMAQYNVVQHQYPAGFAVPLNRGPHEQFQLPGNHGIVEVSANSYGMGNHFMDAAGGSFKRKNADGLSINFQYNYASASSSSSAGPMGARPVESNVTQMDSVPFAVPDGRGNDMPALIDVGAHRSVRNRSGAIGVNSLLPHNTNHFNQGHYPAQSFQPAGNPWMDQQLNSNNGDISTLSWNQPHALPYLHGSFNGGCMEAANVGVHGFQVAASNRSSATFLPPPPPIPHGHFNIHHVPPAPPPMQGTRGHNIDLNPQVATSSRRLSTSSSSHTAMNPFQDCGETGPRFVGPVPPTGLRIFRPHRRDLMIDATARQRNLPHLRVLPEDGVALMELADYHDMGDSIDHHRDMRLDIDHMSYEELLALGEQIGSVGSGLSEEIIVGHLKSRSFVASTSCDNMEDTAPVNQELISCVICQAEYSDQEIMGVLDCGHEYHLDCIKTWLFVKNSCPICKSVALTTDRSES